MARDMDDINKIFDQLFDANPELKKQMDNNEKWRQEKEEYYMKSGMTENDAKNYTWSDYWNMANKRDGVEFSIRRIGL